MEPRPALPFEKNRSRCISCAYLCTALLDVDHETMISLSENRRGEIVDDGLQALSPAKSLRCYKGLITPDALNEEILHNPVCPAKSQGWQAFGPTLSPEIAFEIQKAIRKEKRQIRNLWLTVTVIILVSAILGFVLSQWGIERLIYRGG